MDISRRDFVKAALAGTVAAPAPALGKAQPGEQAGGTAVVEHMLIEWQQRPLALDTARPRFRWTLTVAKAAPLPHATLAPHATPTTLARGAGQSAFQLRISDERGVVYDSGRRAATAMAFRPAQDLALQSQSAYRYSLQVWDQAGHALPALDGDFATGLLTPAAQRGLWLAREADIAPRHAIEGRWQRVAQATPLPLFRKFFHVTKPVRQAHLCIAGLGQYQLWMDGEKVSPNGLNGAWTNYDKRVLYDAYDLSGRLAAGEHHLGVALGNGFFNVETLEGRYSKLDGTFGRPQMWCQLRIVYADGSEDIIASDASWQSRSGGTVYSSLYGGEDYDARLDDDRFDDDEWTAATIVAGPAGRLEGATFQPMVLRRSLAPVAVASPRPGTIVYDFGLNHSGRPHIRLRNLPAGAVVRMLPCELLGEDGGADQQSMVGGKARGYRGIAFHYTARGGDAESWSPQFSYTGYRYLQVEGADAANIAGIESLFLSADVATAGSFSCSDSSMEGIHRLIQQALLSNSASVLTDCPHREKLGWLEQIYLNATTALMNSGMVRIYEKMAADMRDAQEADGKIPTIAPEFVKFLDKDGKDTRFRDSPEWGAALILGAWAVYRLHGDAGILEQNYAAMKRRLAHMETRLGADGLIDFGLGDWYDIGPKNPGVAQLTSRKMTGTATYYAELTTMAEIARRLASAAPALNSAPDVALYSGKAKALRQTMRDKLYSPARATFDSGSQTAQAMALVLGLVPDAHRQRAMRVLVDDIRSRQNHVTAGDIGFHYVVRALTDGGRSDVLHDMLSRSDKPAYLEQINNGATSLTEAWDSWREASQNHFMLGHAEIWFYQGLGGLDIDFSRQAGAISLAPQAVAGITDQAASYDSALGRIACRLRRDGRRWRLTAEIPPGQVARITLPMAAPAAVTEGGMALAKARGVSGITTAGAATTLTAQAGVYEFSWTSS